MFQKVSSRDSKTLTDEQNKYHWSNFIDVMRERKKKASQNELNSLLPCACDLPWPLHFRLHKFIQFFFLTLVKYMLISYNRRLVRSDVINCFATHQYFNLKKWTSEHVYYIAIIRISFLFYVNVNFLVVWLKLLIFICFIETIRWIYSTKA
jgi:hypothetical protein